MAQSTLFIVELVKYLAQSTGGILIVCGWLTSFRQQKYVGEYLVGPSVTFLFLRTW